MFFVSYYFSFFVLLNDVYMVIIYLFLLKRYCYVIRIIINDEFDESFDNYVIILCQM